jgi:hypothetical protein
MTEIGSNGAGAVPDPELVEQAKRRRFTAKYKLRIVQEADACEKPGEVGELLRREGSNYGFVRCSGFALFGGGGGWLAVVVTCRGRASGLGF